MRYDKNTVDIVAYTGNMSIQDDDKLYVADSASYSVYSVFSGFDDMGQYRRLLKSRKRINKGTEDLKESTCKIRFKGRIDQPTRAGVYQHG